MYVSVGDFSGPDGNNHWQGGQQILNRITYGLALNKQRRATVVVLTIMRHMSGASGRSISHMDCSCLAKILPFGSLTFRWCILKNEDEDDPVRPSKTDFSGTSAMVKMDWFSRSAPSKMNDLVRGRL
ncbi:uncharacterized protein ARMOST_11175 [Armillaria ostoyae]|uniref:Uncharacterized protein n=1 Tax=Armillaria ostoyae TaxID=47428 RepID=A0A284RGE5_ARMOS|nr:uncharacterized protein ARMOST_11175 [Armillaria ostoyae]